MNDKLSRDLHYLIYLAQERHWPMGATLLLKSMVLSEAASLYYRQRPLTGAKIVKAPFGPVPDQHDDYLRWLEDEGRIRIIEGTRKYDLTTYESLSPPDLSVFDAQELEIMAEIGETCCKKYSATALSNFTHDYWWKLVGMGEEIPLAAYLWPEDAAGISLSAEEAAQLDMATREGLHA
jgi:hypothetical protein